MASQAKKVVATKLKFKRGDKVVVTKGKDKNKQGEIVKVISEKQRVKVSGVNKAKDHQKPGAGGAGGIVEKELSIHVSNIAHIDPKDNKATKIGYKILEDGRKVRFAKRSGEVIDN